MSTIGGKIGEFFAALSFAGALVASISFFFAERRNQTEKSAWESLGKIGFLSHFSGVMGVIVTLFILIYQHQYQYFYVYDHSSNELPVYYMISCFWEGQEGSFLLWTFWHSILGLALLFRKTEWRNLVLAIVSSVNLILASMILGVQISETFVQVILSLGLVVTAAIIFSRWMKSKSELEIKNLFPVGAILLAASAAYLVISGKGGFLSLMKPWALLNETSGIPYFLFFLFWLFCAIVFVNEARKRMNSPDQEMGKMFSATFVNEADRDRTANRISVSGMLLLPGIFLLAIVLLLMMLPIGDWKIGSTPFILLRQAMAEAPVFQRNPDFIPANGQGLNALLQNYWMVIHPPTLFLGFASTTIPFAFAISGLLKRKYTEWIKPALPWFIFSGLILGTGIIMGGYWAYETLNFGGYWNWDAVENSSLVPWIAVIAGIHSILLFRKSGAFLKAAILLTVGAFLLVLYSTFLTRSGILGNTSVHTFTDLGLSGQLLLLLFFYFFSVALLTISRWNEIPGGKKEVAIISSDFLLFIGVSVLITTAIGITMATSIPVFNKILGTALAPPNNTALFYYEENVWFAIVIAVVCGAAQFLYWNRQNKNGISGALLRPFMFAVISASVIIVMMALGGFTFNLDDEFSKWLDEAAASSNVFFKLYCWVAWGVFSFADEILLAVSIFMVASNVDILIHLLRKNAKSRRVAGGALAHTGFALMLLGMLFSSGFDSTISINPNEKELSNFPDEERKDNILLVKNQPRVVPGFQVTYLGKKEAMPPVRDLYVLEQRPDLNKIGFRDANGEYFFYEFPPDVLLEADGLRPNLKLMKDFLDDKVEFLKPSRLNKRDLFGVEFVPIEVSSDRTSFTLDSTAKFTLYPEAEINPEMGGVVAHPSRKIFLNRDIYVHVSSLPVDEDQAKEPEFRYYTFQIARGDTASTAAGIITFRKLSSLDTVNTPYSVIVKAEIEIQGLDGKIHTAEPIYRIAKDNTYSIKDDYVDALRSFYYFSGIDTETGKIELRVQEEIDPMQDFIVLKAIQKPYINFLWLGTFVMLAGFGVSLARRRNENRRTAGNV